ncbi:MurR/RpiR family transcriptional regulator [Anaerosacchariphilus polymeriproducens]|uniref:MurR/RpiR family transcriptional regulator n=1 Tax=Anaerosacchariphilus polymeriproducens TaxID=1812858 RepID=A0A371AX42_9FIRM|nr:MurR/RpiR family transcriptional regulator [Anaerosacchariphilus polymeriproducens]RDU24154.1 MurR/RpiR family transcriptional regulator [Anaerosacchariphilus polymeriproducens]
MLLFQHIEEVTHQYTDARKAIGEFILNEKSNIKKYSMQEIAEKTYTSKSTLVRFAKILGFSGWKEFLQVFLDELHYEETHYTDIDPNIPFLEGDKTKDLVYKMCNLQIESILDTADQLDIGQVEKAVGLIQKSHNISIFGHSPNIYVGNLFKRKMYTIGRQVLISDGDQGLLMHTLKSNDCAIVISYSGNNPNRIPLRFIPVLKQNHVPVIAITGLGDSYLREHADCVLSMSSREKLYSKVATFATEESIIYILNVLFSCCFNMNYQKNMEYKLDVSRYLEKEERFSLYTNMREDKESQIWSHEEEFN